MIETGGLINVYSDLNPWIDYVISIYGGFETFNKAKEIIKAAFTSWFEDEDAHAITMVDWIKEKLDTADIVYDFYYKEESDDEDV